MSKVNKHGPRATGIKAAVGVDKRKRYDLWSRLQSDAFRWKVAEILENRASMDHCHNCDPYDYLARLPDICWNDGATEANVAVTQLRALFSKDEDLRSPIDTEAEAVKTFLESEESCRKINDAILEGRFGVNDPDVAVILHYSRQKIAEILGDAPLIEDLQLSFGPGAAVTCRKKTSARHKLSSPPSISRPALAIVGRLREMIPRWYDAFGQILVVPGSLEFVTKNYKTKRPIVIGPSVTGMAQRAVGSVMKKLLLHAGVDLYKGQTRNRNRARNASLTGDDGTVDLKAASDSISYMLVLELLPLDWVELLDWLRDDRVKHGSSVIQLEKFSSMGNGYTFELESLLFYALTYGIARLKSYPFDKDTILVYGDDIIAPSGLCRDILEYFPKFGFTPNIEKSFIEGPFRESCGGDYVRGVDVRPFFIRNRCTHHVLVCMYNHLMRKPHQDADRKIRDLILSTLPIQFQNFGPDGYGDGHLISGADFQTYAQPHNRKNGYGGFVFDTWVEVPTRDRSSCIGDILLPSYLVGLRDEHSSDLTFGIDMLRGPFRDAFIRQYLEEFGTPLDHYVIRKGKEARVRGKRVRIYVFDPSVKTA